MNTDRLETIAASDDVERDIDAKFRAKLFGVRILQRAVSISLAITQRISLKMIPGRSSGHSGMAAMARTPVLLRVHRRRGIRPTEASTAAVCYVRSTSQPAGMRKYRSFLGDAARRE
jgi:hypothetical protein